MGEISKSGGVDVMTFDATATETMEIYAPLAERIGMQEMKNELEELAFKEIIDHLHTDNPAWGARQMSAQLKARGYHVGRRKARRYMNEMDIYPIYPKMNLSKRMQQAKVCPYLLRNAVIDKPNQARSIDITYIPIKRGFLYLTAVIDWHSRWADNIMIERWFRSFKYEEAYLTQYNNIKDQQRQP